MTVLDDLSIPIVQAPLAGGPSTPALAAAVSEAGGLGFVAAGYRSTDAMIEDITATRSRTTRPFGVNVFAPVPGPADREVVQAYALRLGDEALSRGVELGQPRFDDDDFGDKIRLLQADPVAVVSFTFGCPPPEIVARLRDVGSEVWVTVTDVEEAERAETAGASALVVQGVEAGGHRASFVDRAASPEYGLLALLQLIGARAPVPLVATGGIATGSGIAAVLVAGATAAQLGTAFMLCPEAATSPIHREALATSRPTALTRVFTGRLARGISNRLMSEYESYAPIAYPEIHHLTAPLRSQGRREGDIDVVNLWAGQTHELAVELPAGELVRRLDAEARDALSRAQARFAPASP